MSDQKMTISELNIKFTAETADLKAGLAGVTSQLDALKKQAAAINASGYFKTMFAGFSGVYIGKQLLGVGKSAVDMAMDVVESESLFEVSMGNMAEKARAWSEDISNALGLNAYALRESIGTLYNMTTSMGIADDTAYDLSTTLTGLAYDMASFYNLDVDQAFTKLRSGITGETEPLKQLGILVDENTAKQTAYKHGLAATGEELSQQQKVIARYLAILDQTSNAQGDMARTLDSPANQLRIMKEEYTQAAIALGQSSLPIVKEVIPYMTALAQIAKEAISGVAGLTGTTVELSSASGSLDMSSAKSQLESLTSDAEETKQALKGATIGLDELNILSSSTDTEDTDITGDYSWNLSTSGYDMIGELQQKSTEAYENLKNILGDIEPIAKTIGASLLLWGGYKAITGIKNLGTNLKDLKGYFSGAEGGASKLTKGLVGAGGIVAASLSAYDAMYDLKKGTLDMGYVFAAVVGVGGGITIATVALGAPGGIIASLGAAASGLIGLAKADSDFQSEFMLGEFFSHDVNPSIQDLTENIKLAWGEFDTYSGKQSEYQQNIENTTTKIKNTTTSLENLITKTQTAEVDIPGSLDEIKTGFDELKENVENNVENKTNGILLMLDKIAEKASGETLTAIQGLKTQFITLQTLIGNTLAEKQAEAYEIIAEAKAQGNVTKDQAERLQGLMSDIASYSGSGQSEAEIGFKDVAQSANGISFGSNMSEAEQYLKDLISQKKRMKDDIQSTWEATMSQISSLENIVSQNPELAQQMKSLGYNTDTMFSEARQEANQVRDNAMAEMESLLGKAYNTLMDSYNAYTKAAAQKNAGNRGFWDNLTETFWHNEEDGNITGSDYEKSLQKIKNDTSSVYDLIQSLKGYATGGLPQRAELFFARENGIPEMIGRIGSNTAVANNYQIEQGISDAVYRAVVSARGLGGDNQPLIIQVVDDTGNIKTEQYISAAERKNLRDGKITIPIGV